MGKSGRGSAAMRASVLLGALLLVQVVSADESFAGEQLDRMEDVTNNINNNESFAGEQLDRVYTIPINNKIVQLDNGQRCKCNFILKVAGSAVDAPASSVSCDRKCSGKASYIELVHQAGGYSCFTVSFHVRRGRGRITKATAHCYRSPTDAITDWPCPLKDIGFTGPYQKHTNISTWELCALMCHQDNTYPCNYWGYQTTGNGIGYAGDCWFQTGYTSTAIAPGRRSGNADCITAATSDWTTVFDAPEAQEVKRDNLLTTLPILPKGWRVSLEIKPTDYIDGWTNLLHLTIGGDTSQYGDRTPAIFFHPYYGMQISSAINGDAAHPVYHPVYLTPPTIDQWTAIVITQQLIGGTYKFYITIGGQLVYSIQNTDAREFSDVKVYASDPWYPAQPALIKNIKIEIQN